MIRSRRSVSYTGKRRTTSKLEKIKRKMILLVKQYCRENGINYNERYSDPESALFVWIQEAAENMVDYYKYTQWSDITDFEETVRSFMVGVYEYLDYDNNLDDYVDARGMRPMDFWR
jgi:hypothetical protein